MSKTIYYINTFGKQMFLNIPEIVGRWLILDKISTGYYGVVFSCRCQDSDCGEIFAIKFELEKRGTILNELTKIYIPLKNSEPTIPKLIDHGIINGINYIVMEKLTPLRNINFNVVQGMLKAIENLHKYNLSHNDIKLENFMQRNNGEVVIIDFGISTYFGFYDREKPLCIGTPFFMSLNAHNHIIHRTNDLESLLYSIMYFFAEKNKMDIWKFEQIKNKSICEQLQHLKNIKKLLFKPGRKPKNNLVSEYIYYLRTCKTISYEIIQNILEKYF